MESNSLDPLLKKYDIEFLVRSNIGLGKQSESLRVIRYNGDASVEKRRMRFFNILMHKYKNRSISFWYRIYREKTLMFNDLSLGLSLREYLLILLSTCLRLKNNLINKCLSFFPEELLIKFLKYNLVNQSLASAILAIKPDLVILPSSAYASEDIDFSIICRNNSIKNFLLVDNWDNMSSKSILPILPDYVGVWGAQSREHAIKIQNFQPNQVFLIGSARFDAYFKFRNQKIESHYPYPYVLFVGTALYFDEIKALKVLDAEIAKNRNLYGNLKVVYRPHPWRQKNEVFPFFEFESIILDLQMREGSSNQGVQRQPSLDYYPSLLSNAKFVIGGMTSMMIESLIFRKKFLGLIYEEEGSITSPHMVYSCYEHFNGVDQLKSVTLCRSIELLPDLFSSLCKASVVIDFDECDLERRYFLFDDGDTYAERLGRIISNVVKDQKNEIH
jgi:hypothetical protein